MSNGQTPTPPAVPWYMNFANIREIMAWLLLVVSLVVHLVRGGGTVPEVVPVPNPSEPVIVQGSTGWVEPTPEETAIAMKGMEAQQGMPAQFSRVGRAAMEAADDHSEFFWLAETKVLGRVLGSWDQGPYGVCTSEGYGRGSQDAMLLQIFHGSREEWPGHEVATEPIYGGSRVQIGLGRIGRGDGSTGAWCAQWVQKYGLNFREKYGTYDLSEYSGSLSRKWGVGAGVPQVVQDAAKTHPVRTVAQIQTGEELWAAIGNDYPVPVCSNVGFEGNPPSDGIMSPRGTWGHCMLFRGRFISPTKGKCFVIQNSWGDYLHGRLTVHTKDVGDVQLPEGCFAVTLATADRMVKQNDSFALSGVVGFPARKMDWPVRLDKPQRGPREALFALAP